MRTVARFSQKNNVRHFVTALVLLCGALVPEYLLPILCVTAYGICVRRTSSPQPKTERFLLLYLAWVVIGAFYSHSLTTTFTILGTWVLVLLGERLVLSAADSRETLDDLLLCGAVSGGVAGAVGVLQICMFHFCKAPLKTMLNPFWHPLDKLFAEFGVRVLPDKIADTLPRTQFIAIANRASGPFTNPVFFALFLCMMVPLCTYGIFYMQGKRRRILSGICLVLSVGGIASSYSRGPYLAVGVLFFVLLFYGRKHAWKIAGAGICGLVAILCVAGGVFRRLLTLFSRDDISINTRSSIWKACGELLRGHWLFGYGTGIGNVRVQLHEIYHIRQPHAHNLFLEILMENGVIGLLLFLAVLAVFVVQMIRLAKCSDKARGVAVSLLASVAAFCACGMTDYIFYGMKPLCYFVLLLGLSEAAVRIYAKAEPSAEPEPTEQKELLNV